MTESKRKHNGIFGILFGITARTAMLMNAGVLVLSYLSMYVNPSKAWFMTVFGILFILFFAVNLFLLLWALRRRSRAVVIPLVALLPAFFLMGRYIQMGNSPDPDASADIRIVSYNVGKFSQAASRLKLSGAGECADSVFAFLLRTDADVICLQEFHIDDAGAMKKYLASKMDGYASEYYINVDDNGAYGNVTLSRFPVVDKGKFDFDHSSNLAIYTDLRVGDRTVRVYNCHFESYNISVSRLLHALSRNDNETVGEAEEKMRSSITRRPEQVGIILDDIHDSPVESIVAGDFNDTPMSYTYTKLKQGHKDSFMEAGKGMGGTYSLLWPFIRIDYVLFPDFMKAVSHKVKRIGWSDHYPIITELKNI